MTQVQHDKPSCPELHPSQSLGMPVHHPVSMAKYELGILEAFGYTQLPFRHDSRLQKIEDRVQLSQTQHKPALHQRNRQTNHRTNLNMYLYSIQV
jgi:hypothetical protein